MSFFASTITTEGLRHNNRAIVLNALRANGPSAHTAIAERTGLASGTVSVITGELLAEGVLEKIEQTPASGRGRPRILFAPRAGFAHFVLVRIAADRVEYSLFDYRNTLLDRKRHPRDPAQTDAQIFGVQLKQQLADFIARSKIEPADVKVISITTNGEVHDTKQTLLWSPIFGDQTVDFRAILAPEWTAKVTLTNDISYVAHAVITQAIGEGRVEFGDRFAVLSLSDSIGLGVAKLNDMGEVELSSPSFGHMPHNTDGPLCRCGAQGCLESYAGFYGILRAAFNAPVDVIPAKFIPLEQMAKLAATARAGDRMTEFAFRQAGVALGLCLSRMFNVLGPMPLTIVGKGLEFFDLLGEGMREQLGDSFQVRMGDTPMISLQHSWVEMAIHSNASACLHDFDRAEVATRKYSRKTKL